MLDILLYALVILSIILAIVGLFDLILIVIIPEIRAIMETKRDNKK